VPVIRPQWTENKMMWALFCRPWMDTWRSCPWQIEIAYMQCTWFIRPRVWKITPTRTCCLSTVIDTFFQTRTSYSNFSVLWSDTRGLLCTVVLYSKCCYHFSDKGNIQHQKKMTNCTQNSVFSQEHSRLERLLLKHFLVMYWCVIHICLVAAN